MPKQPRMDEQEPVSETRVQHGSTGEAPNETTPATQRDGQLKVPVGPGPQLGSKREYLPAAYLDERVVVDKKGNTSTVKLVREDR